MVIIKHSSLLTTDDCLDLNFTKNTLHFMILQKKETKLLRDYIFNPVIDFANALKRKYESLKTRVKRVANANKKYHMYPIHSK